MFSKNKITVVLLIIALIISSISVVSAMEIQGGAFSTDGGPEELTIFIISPICLKVEYL